MEYILQELKKSSIFFSILSSEWSQEMSTKFVSKNKFLLDIKPHELKKSLQRLKRLEYSVSDIRTHPTALLQNDFQLLNNFHRLKEVGFANVTLHRLANVKKIMSKSVHFNQTFNFLPKNINILQHIHSVAKVAYTPNDNMTYEPEMQLETVHKIALRNFMLNHIKYSPPILDEIYFKYPGLGVRSLGSIQQSATLLEGAFKTTINQLPQYILTMQPEDIQEMLDEGTVCGIDVRNVMVSSRRCNLERIREIQKIFHSYKIPEYVLGLTPILFSMNFDTLRERIDTICKLKRANEFLNHIDIGKVISIMGRLRICTDSRNMQFGDVFNDDFVE